MMMKLKKESTNLPSSYNSCGGGLVLVGLFCLMFTVVFAFLIALTAPCTASACINQADFLKMASNRLI